MNYSTNKSSKVSKPRPYAFRAKARASKNVIQELPSETGAKFKTTTHCQEEDYNPQLESESSISSKFCSLSNYG